MPIYHVYAAVGGTKYLGAYEAESESGAIEQAEKSGECVAPNLCHQCASEMSVGDLYDLTAELESTQ